MPLPSCCAPMGKSYLSDEDLLNTFAAPPDMKVDVPEYTLETDEEKRKSVANFHVSVETKLGQWVVKRKYKDFEDLNRQLSSVKSSTKLKLPGKGLLQLDKLDQKFLDSRRAGLATFLHAIIVEEALLKHQATQEFLELTAKLRELHQKKNNDVNLGVYATKTKMQPDDFNFLKEIGKGSFATVFQAEHKLDKKVYAIKVLNKDRILKKREEKHIMAERNILQETYRHPFLVSLHYAFQTKEKLYFVLDFINGGELFWHIQRDKVFTMARAKFYSAEIASALAYLHSVKIIYRDLKPENILLDFNGHIIITDFGLCKIGGNQATTFCGTPEYLAPEVIRKEAYTHTVDWWTLGSVLYEMLLGLPPWYSKDQQRMSYKILNEPLTFETRKSISLTEEARDILRKLLNKDKDKRLGSVTGEVMKHSFFNDIDFQKLEMRQLEPPYRPELDDENDTRNIDSTFTVNAVPASVRQGAPLTAIESRQDPFGGFTYNPNAMQM